jgi:uroporphyrin-III C-methyltransferase
MGVARCEAVQHALLSTGMAGSTPVSMVENATLPRERQFRTSLEHLARDVSAHRIESPAIMVIGKVAHDCNAGEASAPPYAVHR